MTLTPTCAADADDLQFLELLAEVPPQDFLAVLAELAAIATGAAHSPGVRA